MDLCKIYESEEFDERLFITIDVLHKQWHVFEKSRYLGRHDLFSIDMQLSLLLFFVLIEDESLNGWLANTNVTGDRSLILHWPHQGPSISDWIMFSASVEINVDHGYVFDDGLDVESLMSLLIFPIGDSIKLRKRSSKHRQEWNLK